MRGETQSSHLANMIQKHKLYPEYELVLPLFLVKKNSLKKLSEGDIFLLGDESLNLKLLQEGDMYANVEIQDTQNSRRINIVSIQKNTVMGTNSKKYENVKCSFSFLQSRVFEVGHTIDISSVDLKKVDLFVGDKQLAKGILINVDEEIAIQIEKVK